MLPTSNIGKRWATLYTLLSVMFSGVVICVCVCVGNGWGKVCMYGMGMRWNTRQLLDKSFSC